MKKLILILILGGAGFFFWKTFNKPAPAPAVSGPQVAMVISTKAVRKDMPIMIKAVGQVQPSMTVAVKSRIEGEIIQVGFKEGQDVKAGDTLFVIDPRSLQLQLRQAEANLSRDRAQLISARSESERFTELAKRDFASKQQFEKAQATLATLEASIKAGEAAVESTRLQLSFTTIKSPIDGRTGAVLIDKGNLVKANDSNPLTIINQIRPIQVSFAIPEKYVGEVSSKTANNILEVEAQNPEGKISKGELVFINNTTDRDTATIQLKASFTNEDLTLWPGQFVKTTLVAGIEKNAVVVPNHAVQADQAGSIVYVINKDDTVSIKHVKVLRSIEGEAVIASGLEGDEELVLEGHIRLTPGAKIKRKG